MDNFSKADLQNLISNPQPPCISLYMPMHRTMPGALQNPIRFRNLIGEAERKLSGYRQDVKPNGLLNRAKSLLNETDFWLHPANGLAVFISPGQFGSYRLPLNFAEMLVVTSAFHTKPLLPLFTGDGRFYVLALSQNEVRVLACDRRHCAELEVPRLPRNLDALNDIFEKERQLHTFGHSAAGDSVGIHHGHGADERINKDTLLRYFREIDRRLHAKIKDTKAPLVVAAVEYQHSIYREANTYPHLLDTGVIGNPELLKAEELHQQAWLVVEPHFFKTRAEAAARYEGLKGRGRASNVMGTIVSGAYYGRVETLFVEAGQPQWGTFDMDTNGIELHPEPQPGDVDLLDAAATQTLLNNGVVYADALGQVPDGGHVAAILRY